MQRVNVTSDEDALAGLCAFVDGSQSIATDFLDELVGTGLFHPFVQDAVGQRFLPRQFGVRVKDMAEFY